MRGIITGALAMVVVSSAAVVATAATGPAKKKQAAAQAQAQTATQGQAVAQATPAPTPAPAPNLKAQDEATDEHAAQAAPPAEMHLPDSIDFSTGAPAGGVSTAALPEQLETKSKRKLKGEFYSEVNLGANDVRNRAYNPETANYFGLKYALAEGQSLAIKQIFEYSYSSEKSEGEAKVGDTYLQYVNGKLAQFGETGSLTGVVRVYFPTGEQSRFVTKTRGALYGALSAGASVGKVDVSYNLVGTLYNQSQDYFFTDDGPSPTRIGYFIQYAEAVFNLSDKWSITHDLGTTGYMMNALPGDSTHVRHRFLSDTYLNFQPNPNVLLALGLYNDIWLTNSKTPFQMMRWNDLTYAALMQLTL